MIDKNQRLQELLAERQELISKAFCYGSLTKEATDRFIDETNQRMQAIEKEFNDLNK